MKIWLGLKRFFRSMVSFAKETRAELRKVVWPSWAQVRVLTVIVLLTMISLGAVLWGTDITVAFALSKILQR